MDVFFISAKTLCNLPALDRWEILKVKEESSTKELLDLPAPEGESSPTEVNDFFKGAALGTPFAPSLHWQGTALWNNEGKRSFFSRRLI